MKKTSAVVFFSFCIFFISWVVVESFGFNKLAIQSEDALPSMFIPVTVIKEKTLYADTYYEMIREEYPNPDDKNFQKDLTPFYFKRIVTAQKDRYISAFPIISGLLAIPIYLLPVISGMSVTWLNLIILSKASSALIVALSGGVLYFLLRKHFYVSEKNSLILSCVYLFGTVNFALISQALWQHGALQLVTLLTLWFIFEERWFLVGLFTALAVLTRPTAIIFVPFLILLMLNRLLKSLAPRSYKSVVFYFVGMLPVILFFFWYTSFYYHGIGNNGYSNQIFSGWLSRFPEGFLGLWFSPSKGILVYSPVFIFSIIGALLVIRNGGWRLRKNFKYVLSACIVFLYTMVLSRWKHWYGGWSFGYRMASDILPFFIFLLVPFVESDLFSKYKNLFFMLFGLSVLVQVFGMIFFDGVWHAAYDRGFVDTSWLWSIKDSEFIFNVRRVLVKLGYLEKACPKCL